MIASCVMAGSRRARERNEKSKQNCLKQLKKREKEQQNTNKNQQHVKYNQNSSSDYNTQVTHVQAAQNQYIWYEGQLYEKKQLKSLLENQKVLYQQLVGQIISNLQEQQQYQNDCFSEDDDEYENYSDEKQSVSCCYTNQKHMQQELEDIQIQDNDELVDSQQQQQNSQYINFDENDSEDEEESEFLTEFQDEDSLFEEFNSQGSTFNTSNPQSGTNINFGDNIIDQILENDNNEGTPQKIQISKYNNQQIMQK